MISEIIELLSAYKTRDKVLQGRIDDFLAMAPNADKEIVEELAGELLELMEEDSLEKEIEVKIDISDDLPPKYHWSRKEEILRKKRFEEAGLGELVKFSLSDPPADFDYVAALSEVVNEDPYEVDDPLERRGRKSAPVKMAKFLDLAMGDKLIGIGLDVARFGDDKTVIVVRIGIHVVDIQRFSKVDVMETTGYIVNAIREWKPNYLNIDGTGGLGAAVYDRLLELDMDSVCDIFCYEMHSKPKMNLKKVADLRTEMAIMLMDKFREGEITLPADKDLADAIAYMKYEVLSTGLFRLADKKKVKKSLRRSPDEFDALALAFYPPRNFEVL